MRSGSDRCRSAMQTGGLTETISDGETGFLFKEPSTESFLGGIRRAFAGLHGGGPPQHHAPQRDGAVLQLGPVGGLLQHAVSEDRVALRRDGVLTPPPASIPSARAG